MCHIRTQLSKKSRCCQLNPGYSPGNLSPCVQPLNRGKWIRQGERLVRDHDPLVFCEFRRQVAQEMFCVVSDPRPARSQRSSRRMRFSLEKFHLHVPSSNVPNLQRSRNFQPLTFNLQLSPPSFQPSTFNLYSPEYELRRKSCSGDGWWFGHREGDCSDAEQGRSSRGGLWPRPGSPG